MNAVTLAVIPKQGGLVLHWRHALPAWFVLVATLLFVYRETASAMVGIWARSDTFAHGYLVLPIVLWLVWRKRAALSAARPQPWPWALLPIGAVALAWLIADLATVNALAQFALVALLVLTVPLLLGLGVTRAIAFPLAFSFFAVPFGEFLLPNLIGWTADFTVLALRLSGVPVFREGTQFVIPSGMWSVVEACSGVRYLIASFMVGTLYAYLNYRSPRRRLVFVGVSLLVPIVANWIRAYLIVMLGHLSSNRLAVGVDHLIYGWLFFGLVIGALYMIGAVWSEPDRPTAVPIDTTSKRDGVGVRQPAVAWALAVSAIAVGMAPQWAAQAIAVREADVPVAFGSLGELGKGWTLRPGPLTDWRPAFNDPPAQLHDTYASAGGEVGLYVGYYRAQDYERKLVSSSNELVRSIDRGWAQPSAAVPVTVDLPQGALKFSAAQLKRETGRGDSEPRLAVWKVYWVGDRLTASDSLAKFFGTIDRLLGRGDDAAVILIYSREGAPGEATALLESFARAHLDAVVAQLRQTRRGLEARIAAGGSAVTRSR
jgi:exosortase A